LTHSITPDGEVTEMRRRELMRYGVFVVAAWPLSALAQQKTTPLIGFLGISQDEKSFMDPFRQGLSETGYVADQDVVMEHRIAHFQYERLPSLAAELVSRKVDLIVTHDTPNSLAAKNATSTIPILFTFISDPVGVGLVANLARPGGNLTGFSNMAVELAQKRLELISELVPHTGVIALLTNPKNPIGELVIRAVQAAADVKGVKLAVLKASTGDEIESAFVSLVQLQAAALIVDDERFFSSRRSQLIALASRHAIPTIYSTPNFAANGGLISYGISGSYRP
jgi:putative ABC transport system substrate-binding protein